MGGMFSFGNISKVGVAFLMGGTIFGGPTLVLMAAMECLRVTNAQVPAWLLSTDFWPRSAQVTYLVFGFWGVLTMFIVCVLRDILDLK